MIKRVWYVLHVKPRTDKKLTERLRQYGYFAYCVTYTKIRKVQRRKVRIAMPLFPGYVFTRLNADERRRALETDMVVRTIVIPNPRQTIHELRQIVRASRSGRELHQTNPYKVGDIVRVEYGPFRGMEGYVKRTGRNSTIVLNIDILGQAIEVAILPDDCKPAEKKTN